MPNCGNVKANIICRTQEYTLELASGISLRTFTIEKYDGYEQPCVGDVCGSGGV